MPRFWNSGNRIYWRQDACLIEFTLWPAQSIRCVSGEPFVPISLAPNLAGNRLINFIKHANDPRRYFCSDHDLIHPSLRGDRQSKRSYSTNKVVPRCQIPANDRIALLQVWSMIPPEIGDIVLELGSCNWEALKGMSGVPSSIPLASTNPALFLVVLRSAIREDEGFDIEAFRKVIQRPPLQILAEMDLPATQYTLDLLAKIPAYAASEYKPPGFILTIDDKPEFKDFIFSRDIITIGVMSMLEESKIEFLTLELLKKLSWADEQTDVDSTMTIFNLEVLLESNLIDQPLTTLDDIDQQIGEHIMETDDESLWSQG